MTWSNEEENIISTLNNTFKGFSKDNLKCEKKKLC